MIAKQHGKQLPKSKRVLSNRSKAVLSRFETPKSFAVQYNADNCIIEYSAIKTNLQGIKSNTVKLRELVDCFGEQNIWAWISSWLVNLSGFMDFKISPVQAKTTAILILEEMGNINISEFTLFFKKLRKGDYGLFFGKFNGQIILQGCKKFRTARGIVLNKMKFDEQELYN